MRHTPAFLRKIGLLRKWSFSLFRRYSELCKPRYSVERRMGVWLLLDQVNKVDLHLLCGGVWEEDQLDFLARLARRHRRGRRSVLLDIGAHGGLYSLVLDARLNFDRIVAFEPEPASLAQIRANVLMNNLRGKMEIVDKAVSDKSGVASFTIAHESNRGQSRIADLDSTSVAGYFEIRVTTIDENINENGAIIVAKIDVEGNELNVIKGMRELINNNTVVFQIEDNEMDISSLTCVMSALGAQHVHSIGPDHYYVKA